MECPKSTVMCSTLRPWRPVGIYLNYMGVWCIKVVLIRAIIRVMCCLIRIGIYVMTSGSQGLRMGVTWMQGLIFYFIRGSCEWFIKNDAFGRILIMFEIDWY